MTPWHVKAHRLIAEMCSASYRQAQQTTTGKPRKRYQPYSVPDEARALIACLSTEDEERAKAIFLSLAY